MELYGNKNAPNSDCCLRRNVRGATQFPLHGGELSVAYHHTRRQDNGCGSRQRLRLCSFRRRPRKSIRRLLLCRGPTVRGSLCQPVLAVTTLPQRFDGPMINPVSRIVNREKCFGDVFLRPCPEHAEQNRMQREKRRPGGKNRKKAGGRAGKIALVLCHTATALLNGEVPDATGAVERFVQSVHEG